MGASTWLAAAAIIGSVTAHAVQQPLLTPQTNINNNNKKPLVDSEKLQASIQAEPLVARSEDLYKLAELSWHEFNRPTRVIGSAGHRATLDYIWSELAQLGNYYNVTEQTFAAYSGTVFEFRLVLADTVVPNATAFSLTPPTKDKQPVSGDLVLVAGNGCAAADYPVGLKGNVAFIRRGECPFGTKSALAGSAGALAAVVWNNEKGALHGTMGTPEKDHVATFGISLEEAEPYLKKLQAGEEVDAVAYMDAVVETIHTNNIVAQTLGGDQENCVMLGAHSDSVDAGPGINDDGSGTLSLLEVAKFLVDYSVNNCVRFAWWAGEEEGLLGSDYYASTLTPSENHKIRLFMDYDMMGSPNFAYQIYNATNAANPTGSEQLRDLYVAWYDAHHLNYTFIPFDGRSDYDGFIRAGIPAGGIATGAEGVKTEAEAAMFGGTAGAWYDPCYHQLCDDVGNVNVTAWVVNTRLIAHSVATYARSFEGFPERKTEEEEVAVEGVKGYGLEDVKFHGSKLFV